MRSFILIALFLILGFFTTQRMLNPQLNHNSIISRLQHPFDTRLRYKIGQVDPRFHLTEQQFKNIIQQSADIWFLGTSKQYFVYDPNAQLSIHLIYDQRQADSDQRSLEIQRLENSKSSTDLEREKLKHSESTLDAQQRVITQQKQQYQIKLEQYNDQVEIFNHSNHQSADQRAYLQQLKQQLQNDQINIQHQIDQFNAQVGLVHHQVDLINGMNDQFNASVDQFNTRFSAKQFDKGVFNGNEINIYQFRSPTDLKLTIAHELGHGLGLLHSNDPTSLMYPILEKQNFENFTLTPADLALLESRHSF